jgi:hypothetical protein
MEVAMNILQLAAVPVLASGMGVLVSSPADALTKG